MSGQNMESEHPEELLDRARRSTVSPGERRKLHQHLAGCAVCATHLQLASAADQHLTGNVTLAGELTAMEAHLNRVAAHGVLRRLEVARGKGAILSPRRWLQVATGVMLLSGTAAAGGWWAVRTTRENAVTERAPVVASRPVSHAPRLASAPPQPQEAPTAMDDAVPAPAAAAVNRSARAKHFAASAAQLLSQARRLRLDGDDAGARAIYQRLQQGYPRSPESHLSHVMLGRLFLESGDTQQAAQQFSRYLVAGGAAAEEALVGRATAFARMGHPKEEAANWKALLAAHPRSLHAKRARTRLAELGLEQRPADDSRRSQTIPPSTQQIVR